MAVDLIRGALALALTACATATTADSDGAGEGGDGGNGASATTTTTGSSSASAGAGGEGGSSLEEIVFSFDTDLEGFIAETAGGPYDSAVHIAEIGNPGGSVVLNGSDVGIVDGDPNAWIRRSLDLPPWASHLRFDTRAQNDAALRVRLAVGDAPPATLVDWQVLSGGDWVSVELDIESWAGQTVTIYFEQDDDGEGVGEHRYVDNVVVAAQ